MEWKPKVPNEQQHTGCRVWPSVHYNLRPGSRKVRAVSVSASSSAATADAVDAPAAGDVSESCGAIGGGRPPPSSGLSNATPAVPSRTQLKSAANTGFFSVCASKLRHTCTFRPTKYTLLNLRHTRLWVQAGGNIGTHTGRGFLPAKTKATDGRQT